MLAKTVTKNRLKNLQKKQKIKIRNQQSHQKKKLPNHRNTLKIQKEIYIPYFNATEKEIIFSALEEAAGHLCRFYSFSPREWFNHCYDLKTEQETTIESSNKNAFAEIGKYTPVLKMRV